MAASASMVEKASMAEKRLVTASDVFKSLKSQHIIKDSRQDAKSTHRGRLRKIDCSDDDLVPSLGSESPVYNFPTLQSRRPADSTTQHHSTSLHKNESRKTGCSDDDIVPSSGSESPVYDFPTLQCWRPAESTTQQFCTSPHRTELRKSCDTEEFGGHDDGDSQLSADEVVLSSPSSDEWLPSAYDSSSDSDSVPGASEGHRMQTPVEVCSSTDPCRSASDIHKNSLKNVCAETEPSSTSDSVPSAVVVSQTKNGRKWDKKHACKYCAKLVIKMSDHLERAHNDETEVAKILAMKKGSQERRKAWGVLLNEGDFQHNYSVLQSKKGVVIPKYRSGSCDRKTTDLVPCTVCKGMYLKKMLGQHIQKCGTAHNVVVPKKGKSAVVAGQLLTPGAANLNQLFFTRVIGRMKNDEIKDAVFKDPLILKYGERLFLKKDVEEHTPNHISGRMRNLAQVVCTLKQTDKGAKIGTLTEAIHPRNFNTLVQAVKEVCQFDDSTNKFGQGSKALKIGYSLKRCNEILRSDAAKNNDAVLMAQTSAFDVAFTGDWNDFVSACARQSMETARFNAPKLLPTCEDVEKLYLHLKKKREENAGSEEYSELARRLLCQISLLNRKRGGEVHRMKVSEYQQSMTKPAEMDPQIEQSLSPVEQKLSKFLHRVEIRGKFGRRVAILLTPAMKDDVKRIMELRAEHNIDSQYLFASKTGDRPIRGCDVIQHFANEAQVRNPALFTWTSMRKQLATITQTMEITDGDQDMLAKFLDHDIRIHRQFYRLPLDILQKAKVAQILLAANRGARLSVESIEEEMNNTTTAVEETLEADDVDSEDETQMTERPAAQHKRKLEEDISSEDETQVTERPPAKHKRKFEEDISSEDETQMTERPAAQHKRKLEEDISSEDETQVTERPPAKHKRKFEEDISSEDETQMTERPAAQHKRKLEEDISSEDETQVTERPAAQHKRKLEEGISSKDETQVTERQAPQHKKRPHDQFQMTERPAPKHKRPVSSGESSRKKVRKQIWSEVEKAAIHRQLSGCIIMNKVPNQREAQAAIDNEVVLSKRTWKSVKFFVYNIIQKQRRQHSLH